VFSAVFSALFSTVFDPFQARAVDDQQIRATGESRPVRRRQLEIDIDALDDFDVAGSRESSWDAGHEETVLWIGRGFGEVGSRPSGSSV